MAEYENKFRQLQISLREQQNKAASERSRTQEEVRYEELVSRNLELEKVNKSLNSQLDLVSSQLEDTNRRSEELRTHYRREMQNLTNEKSDLIINHKNLHNQNLKYQKELKQKPTTLQNEFKFSEQKIAELNVDKETQTKELDKVVNSFENLEINDNDSNQAKQIKTLKEQITLQKEQNRLLDEYLASIYQELLTSSKH